MLVPFSLSASQVTTNGDVIVSRIGESYLFIFPQQQGRFINASDNPAGKIQIGDTVTIAYALKIIKGGKARFINVDGSKVPKSVIDSLRIALSVQPAPKLFGFLIKDKRQPRIDISINPSFMSEARTKSQWQEHIARSGNLSMILAPDGVTVRILKVYLD